MRALTTREKLLSAVVLIALAITLIQFFIVEPQKKKLQQARTEFKAATHRLTSLYTKVATLKMLRQEVSAKEGQLAALERRLAFQGELAQVLHRLTSRARRNGLHLQYIRPVKSEMLTSRSGRPARFRRSVIEFGIHCRYRDLGEFLTRLEQEPFFVQVAALRMRRGQLQPPMLDVRLTLAIVLQS